MMRIRGATLEDCDLLASVHEETLTERWIADTFRQILNSQAAVALFGESDRGTCGLILYRVAADEAEILTLAVRPAMQRRGFGRQLVQVAAAAAWDKGAKAIFLEVNAKNFPARSLYERLGFLPVGRRPEYYRTETAREEALVLRASLPLTASA
jgi:ribosomal-protein-alanine N-acetyltransferase